MMTAKYCPRGKIKKLEIELWNLKVKGTDVLSYNQRFQDLALICSRMFPEESDEVEKYVGGLPDMIQGSVMASKPKTMQDAIENNQNQQQPFKRYNVARAYTAGPGEKKVYGGSKPLCPKCNYHHNGQCAPKCTKYKRNGHLAWDCRSQPAAANNQRNFEANQRGVTCYECGVQGHYKKDCPKLKNKNQGNQAGNGNATQMVFSKAGLSATTTKLETPLMLDSYTSGMCIQSWGRSIYARALIEVRADVELKDNIVVAMPKLAGEGLYTYTEVVKNMKKPSQTPRGVPVGPRVGFKPVKQVYRRVSKKNTVNTSGNKKKDVKLTIEVSNLNPFDVLNSIENNVDFGTNGDTPNLASRKANSSGSLSRNVESS
ncbi:putative reverse transcriptase domain-containing protein [Tanacetum coccineum]